MNEFDQYVKHTLKANYYIRYADDFVILSHDSERLAEILVQAEKFLQATLHLELHPEKVSIRASASGIDFLGWVHFPDHRVLRTATKRRMLERVRTNPHETSIASYKGLLKHGNTHALLRQIDKIK